MKFRDGKGQQGFTLIEVAIVLMIGGLMLGSAAAGLQVFLHKQQVKTTQERLQHASGAITQFQLVNGRLPCPAPLTAPADTTAFAREILTEPAACNNNTTPAGTFRVKGTAGRWVRIGALPTRTLNLPDELGQDAWGQRFLYAVTEKLAVDGLFHYTDGAISVVDSGGNDIVNPSGRAHYVIASAGDDRAGSYNAATGIQNSLTPQGYDDENWDNNAVFRKTLINSKAEGSNYFNDYVYHNLVQVDDLSNILNCMSQQMFYDPDDDNADVNGCVNRASMCLDQDMLYNPDDPNADADGCVNRIAYCQDRQMLYDTDNTDADADGCVPASTKLEGNLTVHRAIYHIGHHGVGCKREPIYSNSVKCPAGSLKISEHIKIGGAGNFTTVRCDVIFLCAKE